MLPTATPPSVDPPQAPPVRGKPRLIAAGFLFAFALSIVTVVLTGLWVRSPEARRGASDWPPAAARVEAEQTADSVERAARPAAEESRPADGGSAGDSQLGPQ